MLKLIIPFINPIKLIQAWYYQKRHPKDKESNRNSELLFYAKILKNDMLHLGYFENSDTLPEDISFNQIENAQFEYAKLITDRISNNQSPVLDVGCGMGGLSKILFDNGFKVEALTPDRQQKKHIDQKYNCFPCHHTKFEQFSSNTKYGTVINSESLQYIKLDQAFETVEKILAPKGKWIITDYFRIQQNTINKSGHMLNDFLLQTDKFNWKIIDELDITLNILPTLKFVYMYVERFFRPLSEFTKDKLRYKQPWLFYLSGNLREAFLNKANKEIAAIDPEKFAQEKKYMLFVLQKNDF
jgi:cyclopropane fatty-acyl-phospholipid synthase-like methyltransferase